MKLNYYFLIDLVLKNFKQKIKYKKIFSKIKKSLIKLETTY